MRMDKDGHGNGLMNGSVPDKVVWWLKNDNDNENEWLKNDTAVPWLDSNWKVQFGLDERVGGWL